MKNLSLRSRRRVWLSLAALFIGLAQGPRPAVAQAKDEPTAAQQEEASERFRRGVKLYKARDYTAAWVEFKRAYELFPNYNVLYNLGQTSRELKDYATALTSYEEYLLQGGNEVTAARKKEVQASIEELKQTVGRITVSTNVEGAEIFIDDVAVGTSPLPKAVVVNVGQRRIVATKSGFTEARRAIEIAGTDAVEVKLELVSTAQKPGPTPITPPPAPVEPEPAPPYGAFIALGVTGASAIVTGVLGGLALSAQSDLDAALGTFPGNQTAIADAQSRTSSLAVGTDVMIGITAAGAATTVLLFIFTGGSSDAAEPEPAPEGEVSVRVVPMPTGLTLMGTF